MEVIKIYKNFLIPLTQMTACEKDAEPLELDQLDTSFVELNEKSFHECFDDFGIHNDNC